MFLLLNESLIMAVITSERYIADSKRGELREKAIRWDSAVGIPESYIKTNLLNKEIDRNFQDVYTALQNAMGNEGRLGGVKECQWKRGKSLVQQVACNA